MNQNYTYTEANGQMSFAARTRNDYLMFPSHLTGFHQESVEEVPIRDVRPFHSMRKSKLSENTFKRAYILRGKLDQLDHPVCSCCGRRMYKNQTYHTKIKHIPFQACQTIIECDKYQWRCNLCGKTITPDVAFKADDSMITKELEQLIIRYLSMDEFTLTDTAIITGVNINTIKKIDLKRLKGLYADENGKLKKPAAYARYLAIDEFKLHNGHKYATHIIDLITGAVLFIRAGKTKAVVEEFMELVGDDWMHHVEAVAMDMNSDFQEAFKAKCGWIQIVYDHFHIVKNFNEKVIAEVRKEEQIRLKKEGLVEEATVLKGSRKILCASRESLQKHDQEAREGKVCRKGSAIFGTTDYRHTHDDFERRYDDIINSNKLLFTCDLIKQAMQEAYASANQATMIEKFTDIIDWCRGTKNEHFLWFARLIENHFDGIVGYGLCPISSGKIEGINAHIKVIRRKAYGLPDDEYFFLKIMDASRNPYKRI